MKIDALLYKASLYWWITTLILSAPTFAAQPKYGPAGAPKATPLAISHQYFQSKKVRAENFWALIPFYVPQINGSTCAAAAIAMVVNASRSDLPGKTTEDKVITQQDLLEEIKIDHWKERLTDSGYQGKHGIELDHAQKAMEISLKNHGFPQAHVKVVHIEKNTPKVRAHLIEALKKGETSSKHFIIANFNQKSFTDDFEVGHYAPVAAYDEEAKRVLILDPDREYFEPYWVSLDTFISGMATKSSEGSPRGYLEIVSGHP